MKKDPRITLEQVVKLLTHLTKTLGELSLRVDKMDDFVSNVFKKTIEIEKLQPKKMRTDEEIMEQAYKYLLHRRNCHKGSHGLFICLNKEEFERLKNLMIK